MVRLCRRLVLGAGFLFGTVAFVGAGLIFVPKPAHAHKTVTQSGLSIVVGWKTEPTFTNEPNAISVRLTRANVGVDSAELSVVVSYGPTSTQPLALAAVFGDAGSYEAPLIPSQPGIYTFAIEGRVGAEPVNLELEAGLDTFDEVTESTTLVFPDVDAEESDVATSKDLADEVDKLEDKLSSAKLLSMIALSLGLLGLVGLLRGPRKNSKDSPRSS